MKRLLIVSNRLPITVTKVKKENKLKFHSSVGGLSTGLSSFYKSYNALWIGWPGIALEKTNKDERNKINKELSTEGCVPVFLNQYDIENYYHGFCNKTVWPLFHYFPSYVVNSKTLWNAYYKTNRKFCESVVKIANNDDTIWIHDYQLMLLPSMLRKELPNANIGFFLHIPFPSFEVFRMLPWRREILEGLIGADLIGFHTYDYVRYFLESVRRILGFEDNLGQINAYDHITKADTFPMGIDFERFSVLTSSVEEEIKNIYRQNAEKKIILSVDRLDYTKGILERLEAFDEFLDKNPKYIEKVVLIIVVVPSRTNIEQYKTLKKQIDELIGKINGKRSTLNWTPIRYLYRSLPFKRLSALYNVADIALVTPLRDGMNLIAKEFVATKRDGKGVLILSEMAGASKEMGEAIIINPNDREEIVTAIEKAINMPEHEQIERNSIMRNRLKRYNITKWAQDFTDELMQVKKTQQRFLMKKMTPEIENKIIEAYLNSNKRILLLDYDGTLVNFSNKPEEAKPDEKLIDILDGLCKDEKNDVTIISGRDRTTLDDWFGRIKNIGLTAEHGVWIKKKGEDWQMITPLTNHWKNSIKPILELYMDRTPGSFIEEKEFSLVWHYRKSDSKLAEIRARELKNSLLDLTGNLRLEIMSGNKVIEIKDAGIGKDKAALKWISNKDKPFILAIGDDVTDENIFNVLPDYAYSIKVGFGHSKAKYNIISPFYVREFLKKLSKEGK